jgi:prepilin-type N-terminal cleavage/methylation domain-containing protein
MSWNYLPSYKKSQSFLFANKQKGFGLIEMMVSIGILSIVMGVVFVRQDSHNSSLLLRNQAYEIAFRLREVQFSAVSAQGDAEEFRDWTGMSFDISDDGAYKVLKLVDSTTFSPFGAQGVLDKRFQIKSILVDDVVVAAADEKILIVYERPNFDAQFYNESGVLMSAEVIKIEVTERVSGGPSRWVEITSTGQIGVI